jgi:hypothetical protein
LDAIDDIEAKNNRNLETAELVSAYMRANAQRAAQRTAQQKVNPEPTDEEVRREEAEPDKLDFSSEFTTGDMGLNSHGGSAELLAWKRQIEDEEERRREEEGEEEKEEAEEWKAGAWQDKEKDGDEEQPPEEEEGEEPQESPSDTPTQQPRTFVPSAESKPPTPPHSTQPPTTPLAATPPVATPPVAAAAAPIEDLDDILGTASAQKFWGGDSLGETVAPVPALPRPAVVNVATPTFNLPERLRPAPQSELPVTGQLAQIDPDLAQLAGDLISTPDHEPGYQECVRLLARFQMGALRMCGREKVRVEILDERDFATHPALLALNLTPEETPSDGAYLVERRLVLVDRRCLVGKPRFFHPALYYFAHAFDHAQGGETFSSRKAAAVVACFEASTRAYNGFDFVDELAAADPVRYFARSVAVYLGRDDCSDPLWSHQDLYDFDRSMYDYLQYLFGRLVGK